MASLAKGKTAMMATELTTPKRLGFLEKANGHVKTALVMVLGDMDSGEAQKMLMRNDGFVNKAIQFEHKLFT